MTIERKIRQPCNLEDGKKHGTRGGYNQGCRGQSCADAKLEYAREWESRSERSAAAKRRKAQRKLRADLPVRIRRREWYLRSKYNKDVAWYDAKLAEQGGTCAICPAPEPEGKWLMVDHDHNCCPEEKSCGDCVRGLLCHRCNIRLSPLDDLNWMKSAQDYLTRTLRHGPTIELLYGGEK